MTGDGYTDDRLIELEEQLTLARAALQDALFRERVAEEAIRQLIRHGPIGLVAHVLTWCGSPCSDALRGDVAYLLRHIDVHEVNP